MLWIMWRPDVERAMTLTAPYLEIEEENFDQILMRKWDEVSVASSQDWAHMMGTPNVFAEGDKD